MENHSLKTLIFFAILALISYAVWQRYFKAEENEEIEPFTKGYALEGVEMDITNELGMVTTRISSPSMVYYEDQSVLHMKEPQVLMYSAEDDDWQFTAPTGEYHEEKKMLVFEQEVNLTSLPKAEGVTPIHIVTSGLSVLPDNNTATTENDIAIDQAEMRMSGNGALINLNLQEFRIKRNVKAEFIP
ncbi:LPS export ABC transporter periplasmic protein LptC [Marinicella sp. W31]|uniref:LPS export ABC transporter periplasmic protein LptC n=1 Tax=Marinicella sp. W31 TaxID=3023713 RepID=UPI003757E0BF